MAKPIHECVSEHVEDAGLTKAELARKLGWHYLRTMRLLNGDTELSAQEMADIAKVLRRPVADLYHPVQRRSAS